MEEPWLVADGFSTSAVSLSVADADGRAPPDGAEFVVAATLGRVELPALVEGRATGTLTAGNVWGVSDLSVSNVATVVGDTTLDLIRGDPYSTQLHMHGTISEMSGTYSYQVREARTFGVDVLWWSDHDWGYQLVSAVTTPGLDEGKLNVGPDAAWPDSSWQTTATGGSVALSLAPELSPSGHRPMSITLVSDGSTPDEPTAGTVKWQVEHEGLRRSLLGTVRLGCEVFVPDEDDAQLRIVVDLSQPVVDVGKQQSLVLRDPADPRATASGELMASVDLSPGWNAVYADLTASVGLLLGSIDQAVAGLRFEVERSGPGRSTFAIAGLELTQDLCCDDLRVVQQLWFDSNFARPPVQYVGHEVSWGTPHLNVFGPADVPFEDYTDRTLADDAEAIVADAHAAGAVVSLNHVFGVEVDDGDEPDPEGTTAARCEELALENVYGVDLLEVGYRMRVQPIATHLAVWDCLGARGFLLTGIGTSDSHSNAAWDEIENPFTTWVYAASDERGALGDALARGRAFFGDPTAFIDIPATLDMKSSLGAIMGQVVSPAPLTDEVEVVASPLHAGWVVNLVADGVVIATDTATGTEYNHTFKVEPGGVDTQIRVEVWAGEEGVLYSNPIYYRTDVEGVPTARRPAP